jgi:hypothetical protein
VDVEILTAGNLMSTKECSQSTHFFAVRPTWPPAGYQCSIPRSFSALPVPASQSSAADLYTGPFVGRARALVDCTPSPYDREALRFKVRPRTSFFAKGGPLFTSIAIFVFKLGNKGQKYFKLLFVKSNSIICQ